MIYAPGEARAGTSFFAEPQHFNWTAGNGGIGYVASDILAAIRSVCGCCTAGRDRALFVWTMWSTGYIWDCVQIRRRASSFMYFMGLWEKHRLQNSRLILLLVTFAGARLPQLSVLAMLHNTKHWIRVKLISVFFLLRASQLQGLGDCMRWTACSITVW